MAEELTVEKFAQEACYKEQTVRQKISDGVLPVRRIGRNVRILRTREVEQLIEQRKALLASAT